MDINQVKKFAKGRNQILINMDVLKNLFEIAEGKNNISEGLKTEVLEDVKNLIEKE